MSPRVHNPACHGLRYNPPTSRLTIPLLTNRESAASRAAPRFEPLWSVHVDGVTWEAQLRYHGEYDVEAQILKNGDLVIGRRFDTRALAVQWAEEERKVTKAETTGSPETSPVLGCTAFAETRKGTN